MLSRNQRSRRTSPAGRAARGAASVALALLLLLQFAAAFAVAAPSDKQPDVRMAFSKDSYWYQPGATVKMRVTLDNRARTSVKSVDVRLRVHVKNKSRADLDATFNGKPVKSYKQTETLGKNLTLATGNNAFDFQMRLGEGRYTDGVYPMTIEALKSGSVLASAISEMVVFSSADLSNVQPLRLSMVFDTLEPPHRGPDGKFKNDELAAECNPGKQAGWYSTLVWMTEKWPDLGLSFSMSPMLLEDLQAMSEGYTIKRGDKELRVGPGSKSAENASAVLSGFRRIAQSQRYQVLALPAAAPDLETLVSLRWVSDAKAQIAAGYKTLEKDLDTALGHEYMVPPGLAANTRVLKDLRQEAGQFLMLSPDLLLRTREGKKLLRGNTLAQPVKVMGARKSDNLMAIFEDARMRDLFARVSQSGDSQGVAQCILSELTNFYLEQPEKLRDCAVLWPGWWHPSRETANEVIKAITSAPWLKNTTLGESMMSVPTLDNDPLTIPEPPAPEDEYFAQVGRARDLMKSYTAMVMPENPLLPPLLNDVWVSQSDVWSQWNRKVEGLTYASAAINTIDTEVAKITLPATGSISLTSGDSKIPLTIVNGTSYRITATLELASNGLTFPSGSQQKVRVEPKENLLEIPVVIKKKGRVRFQARLEAQNFILGEVDFTVLTSRFNTFAVMVVAGLLALIGGLWATKLISRRKVGKHKRRNLKEATKEGPGAEGTETPA
jgi:hypothetical protein